ncbi:IS3 family transposase [Aneurinibacillus migulanus]|uniref:IS3 family transposase n=1 Tax=Aneurinibacillus migulanus TaxID=47500 RepID=UPI00209C7E84|nr:IS3 family transposase [Aneurinibacillus migulanus]MCP1359092.1 IS3 family transposase [Aneurinibacillus migulanus]
MEERLRRAEAEIALLRTENDFLKKLERIEKKKVGRNKALPSNKFALIWTIVKQRRFSRMMAYLSCVKASMTREIVSFHLSSSLKMDIAYKTIDKLMIHLGGIVNPGTILHSDQGLHYTHPEFQHRVKKLGLTQSMSRRGNCWDNAPMESFFGHIKDEMEYTRIQSFNELKKCVEAYIERYNYYRCQWTLEKLTPVEYRNQLLAA